MITILCTLISGAFVGWIAGMFMNESGGFLKNAFTGIIGSFIASVICQFLGIYSYGSLFGLAANILGACLFIGIVRKLQ